MRIHFIKKRYFHKQFKEYHNEYVENKGEDH